MPIDLMTQPMPTELEQGLPPQILDMVRRYILQQQGKPAVQVPLGTTGIKRSPVELAPPITPDQVAQVDEAIRAKMGQAPPARAGATDLFLPRGTAKPPDLEIGKNIGKGLDWALLKDEVYRRLHEKAAAEQSPSQVSMEPPAPPAAEPTAPAGATGPTQTQESLGRLMSGERMPDAEAHPSPLEPTAPQEPAEMPEPKPQTKALSVEESVKQYLKRKQMSRAGEKLGKAGSQIGRGLVGLAGIDTTGFPEPGPSREVEDIEDQIPPDMRASIKEATGVDLPKGITWTQLRSTLPSVAGVMQSRISQAYRAEESDWRRTMKEHAQDQADINAGRIPQTVLTNMTNLRETLNLLGDLKGVEAGMADEYGPVATRWNKILKTIGLDSAKLTEFSARATDMFARYLYKTSGKQLSNKELDFMRQTFFDAAQNPTTFRRLMESVKSRLSVAYNSLLESQANNQRNVEPHLLPGYKIEYDATGRSRVYQPGGAGGEDMIEVEAEGETGTIPRSAWEQFKADHPDATIVGE